MMEKRTYVSLFVLLITEPMSFPAAIITITTFHISAVQFRCRRLFYFFVEGKSKLAPALKRRVLKTCV
jgi:hypothetical protein